MTIYIKIIIVAIIIILLYLFIKKEKETYKENRRKLTIKNRSNHKNRLQKEIIKSEVIISFKEKQKQLENLYSLIDLIVNKTDAEKLKKVISEKVKKENKYVNWSILDEFMSSEISKLELHQNINFRSHFDWKFESFYLRDFIVKTMKSNFDINFNTEKICDLNENKFIHEAFPYYQKALNYLNIKLRIVDINSDSYQIVLFKKENEEKIDELVKDIGFTLRTIS